MMLARPRKGRWVLALALACGGRSALGVDVELDGSTEGSARALDSSVEDGSGVDDGGSEGAVDGFDSPDSPPLTVFQVSAGAQHTCAALSSGALLCWGRNLYGQLGDGTPSDRHVPASVPIGGVARTVSASALGDLTCAILQSGTLQCWGLNYGDIGDGTYTIQRSPANVVGLDAGGASVSPGFAHTCATLTTGAAFCWGHNYNGELGDGTLTMTNRPTPVSALDKGASLISAGGSHSCALLQSGIVTCWGSNDLGELGDGTTMQRSTPVPVLGVLGVIAVGAGSRFSCGLTKTGSVQCWGKNDQGQLGDGTTVGRTTAAVVQGLGGVASRLSVGRAHSCVVLTTGTVRCWGDNGSGQLGDGTTQQRSVPTDVVLMSSTAVSVSAGGDHTCVVTSNGHVQCWGGNDYGQLGNGTTTSSLLPVTVMNLP